MQKIGNEQNVAWIHLGSNCMGVNECEILELLQKCESKCVRVYM